MEYDQYKGYCCLEGEKGKLLSRYFTGTSWLQNKLAYKIHSEFVTLMINHIGCHERWVDFWFKMIELQSVQILLRAERWEIYRIISLSRCFWTVAVKEPDRVIRAEPECSGLRNEGKWRRNRILFCGIKEILVRTENPHWEESGREKRSKKAEEKKAEKKEKQEKLKESQKATDSGQHIDFRGWIC